MNHNLTQRRLRDHLRLAAPLHTLLEAIKIPAPKAIQIGARVQTSREARLPFREHYLTLDDQLQAVVIGWADETARLLGKPVHTRTVETAAQWLLNHLPEITTLDCLNTMTEEIVHAVTDGMRATGQHVRIPDAIDSECPICGNRHGWVTWSSDEPTIICRHCEMILHAPRKDTTMPEPTPAETQWATKLHNEATQRERERDLARVLYQAAFDSPEGLPDFDDLEGAWPEQYHRQARAALTWMTTHRG